MTPNDEDRALMMRRVVRYGVAGVFATVLYLVVTWALVEVGALAPVVAAAVATGVVIISSYIVNRAWVFTTDRSHASAFSRFVVASALSMSLNTGLMYLAVQVLGWRYWIGLGLATLVVPPTNFVINQFWSFRARS